MKAWFIGPDEAWLKAHAHLRPEANIDKARCPETLANEQCVLIEGHDCEHLLDVFPRPSETPATQ